MGLLSSIMSAGVGNIVEAVGNVADRFIQTSDEKAAFKLEVEKLVTERLKFVEQSAIATVQSRMQVIIAELQHGDTYTKRTRPMIARWGLYVIIWNYAIVPTIGQLLTQILDSTVAIKVLELPTEFWIAWGGIVGTYAIGRSFEKVGVENAMTRAATGKPSAQAIAEKTLQGALQ